MKIVCFIFCLFFVVPALGQITTENYEGEIATKSGGVEKNQLSVYHGSTFEYQRTETGDAEGCFYGSGRYKIRGKKLILLYKAKETASYYKIELLTKQDENIVKVVDFQTKEPLKGVNVEVKTDRGDFYECITDEKGMLTMPIFKSLTSTQVNVTVENSPPYTFTLTRPFKDLFLKIHYSPCKTLPEAKCKIKKKGDAYIMKYKNGKGKSRKVHLEQVYE